MAKWIREPDDTTKEAADLTNASCTIVYTRKAWFKTLLLVESRNKEVGWHGVARRVGDNHFVVDDIVVFPQEVTGASTTPDDIEYTMWQDSLDTKVFNNIRMYGHSHVNFAPIPSATDMRYRSDMLTAIDTFYIFQIFNKRGHFSSEVYDVENNILYENCDVRNRVMGDIDYTQFVIMVELLMRMMKDVEGTRSFTNMFGWFCDVADEIMSLLQTADELVKEK